MSPKMGVNWHLGQSLKSRSAGRMKFWNETISVVQASQSAVPLKITCQIQTQVVFVLRQRRSRPRTARLMGATVQPIRTKRAALIKLVAASDWCVMPCWLTKVRYGLKPLTCKLIPLMLCIHETLNTFKSRDLHEPDIPTIDTTRSSSCHTSYE